MTPLYRMTWVFPDGTERETDGYRQFNLLGHAEICEIPMRQACGGKAECGTCRVRVISGTLTDIGPGERELMMRFPKRFEGNHRLGCQARPRSDVRFEVVKLNVKDLRALEAN